jgi:hypothetical protein
MSSEISPQDVAALFGTTDLAHIAETGLWIWVLF